MKKILKGQVLVTRTTEMQIYVSFYEVIKSTTNTCEIRELRKNIVNQTHDEQEVIPDKNIYIGKPIRRQVHQNGCVKIRDSIYAWPWDGTSQWQSVIIFIP